MSIEFLSRFQLKLHQTLTESAALMDHVREVYISVVQDGVYPFISINFLKSDNYSSFAQHIYSVDFEICIFSRDINKRSLITIGSLVQQSMSPELLAIDGYHITGLRINHLHFDEAKDMIHNKLTMKYKTMIKKVLA